MVEVLEFSKTIDDFINGNINPYAQIFVCKTTDAMIACGAKNLDVIINQSTLRKIMSDDTKKYKHPHNLGKNIIKSIPNELNDPVMIFNGSEPSSIVLISNLTDEHNQNIIISCKLNSTKSLYEVNEITSVYPKNNISNYINTQLDNHKLIGCNKKRANRLLKSLGLQSSEVEASIDYTDIISNSDGNVNIKNNQQANNTLSKGITKMESTSPQHNDFQKQHLNRLKTIAEYEQRINVSPEERIVEMNYSTTHWQPKDNITPDQAEAVYNHITDDQRLGFKRANEMRRDAGKSPLTSDEYYHNIKNMAFVKRFTFGDENSIDIEAIKSALKEVPAEYVISQMTPEQLDLYADYYETAVDLSSGLEAGLSKADAELYNSIISIRNNEATLGKVKPEIKLQPNVLSQYDSSIPQNTEKSQQRLSITGLQSSETTNVVDCDNSIGSSTDFVKKSDDTTLESNCSKLRNLLIKNNESPAEVLTNKELLQWYSFASQINNLDELKEALQYIDESNLNFKESQLPSIQENLTEQQIQLEQIAKLDIFDFEEII